LFYFLISFGFKMKFHLIEQTGDEQADAALEIALRGEFSLQGNESVDVGRWQELVCELQFERHCLSD
jgi:hypothetical protein